jgi:hypothetical protein
MRYREPFHCKWRDALFPVRAGSGIYAASPNAVPSQSAPTAFAITFVGYPEALPAMVG